MRICARETFSWRGKAYRPARSRPPPFSAPRRDRPCPARYFHRAQRAFEGMVLGTARSGAGLRVGQRIRAPVPQVAGAHHAAFRGCDSPLVGAVRHFASHAAIPLPCGFWRRVHELRPGNRRCCSSVGSRSTQAMRCADMTTSFSRTRPKARHNAEVRRQVELFAADDAHLRHVGTFPVAPGAIGTYTLRIDRAGDCRWRPVHSGASGMADARPTPRSGR